MAQKVVFRVTYPLSEVLGWRDGLLRGELERRAIGLWQAEPEIVDADEPCDVEVVPDGVGFTVSILVPAEPARERLLTKFVTALAKDPASCAYWLIYLMQALENQISPLSWRTRILASLEKRIHRRLITGHW